MRLNRTRTIVKCAAFAAAVAFVPALLATGAPARGPYSSALANFGTAAALAAPTCNQKACSSAPHGLKFTCVSSSGTNCKTVNGGKDCAINAC